MKELKATEYRHFPVRVSYVSTDDPCNIVAGRDPPTPNNAVIERNEKNRPFERFVKYWVPYNSHRMVQSACVKTKEGDVRDRTPAEGSDDFDIDKVIARMKEVGHRDSDGYLVLPKYYDE